MIKAEVVADSINEKGNRITSFVVVFPRIILAEKNTHRVFSRNSASSRAIPFPKMVKSVRENPFIPIAWQKDHKGMQGTEYFSKDEKFEISVFIQALNNIFKEDQELIKLFTDIFEGWKGIEKTLDEWWLVARDYALESSILLACFGVTKQLCNRLLEPFMWHTVIVTATEWENFFALRCPQYQIEEIKGVFRSKKDYVKASKEQLNLIEKVEDYTNLQWLQINKGQAEIHMMALAEAMWDAYNESIPKELKVGEWHIPFGDNLKEVDIWNPVIASKYRHLSQNEAINLIKIKIAVARCARVSYTIVGEEDKKDNYENDIKLHNRLLESRHMSPFEHCATPMHIVERENNGEWSGNFRGFIQYRKLIPNENITK